MHHAVDPGRHVKALVVVGGLHDEQERGQQRQQHHSASVAHMFYEMGSACLCNRHWQLLGSRQYLQELCRQQCPACARAEFWQDAQRSLWQERCQQRQMPTPLTDSTTQTHFSQQNTEAMGHVDLITVTMQ